MDLDKIAAGLAHNTAVVDRRIADLAELDAADAQTWSTLVGEIKAAGKWDNRVAMTTIAGLTEVLIFKSDRK